MLTHLLGWLGAAFSMTLLWPQVWRSCVARRTGGLSATSIWLGVAMPVGWVIYGLFLGDRIQVVTNSVTATAGVAILTAVLLTRPDLRTRRTLLTTAAGAAGVLTAAAVGTAATALPGVTGARVAPVLGAVLAATSLLSAIPQPLALLRDRDQDLSGLSPLRWRMAAGACSLWLAYGLGTGHPAVWASALVGLTSATIVCTVLYTASRRPTPARTPAFAAA